VLAGHGDAVDAAAVSLSATGVNCRLLPVDRAYHTPLMAKAQDALSELLGKMSLQPSNIPLCCNGTGDWMQDVQAVDPAYWAAHVASTVRWAQNMDALAIHAPAAVLEVRRGLMSPPYDV